jgi:hypothetical protein
MNLDARTILRKTQAFLRGLEATLDEFIDNTVSRGETLLDKERQSSSSDSDGQPATAAGPRDAAV